MIRVGYIGNFTARDAYGDCFNTECHYARAFEANGCAVTQLQEPRPLPDEPEAAFAQRQLGFCDGLMDLVGSFDLLLYTRTWSLPDYAEAVWRAHEEAGTITAAVHLDLFWGLDREHELAGPMFRMGHVFTADGDHEARWRDAGINHHWLRAGVVEDECVPGTYRDEYAADVVFVGGGHGYHAEWPHRQQLLTFLRDRYGDRFRKWGGPEAPTIRGRDLNDLYASARVVVGDSLALGGSRTRYWSDRIYETLGRGGFLIFPRLGALVREIPLLPTYEIGDFSELAMHIDYWLEHDTARESLRAALQEHVRSHCTYTHRARTILETVGLAQPEAA